MQNFGPLEGGNPLALIRNLEIELRNIKARLAQLDVGGHPNLGSGVPAGVLQPLAGGTGHALLGSPLGVTVWLSPGAGTRGTVVVATTTDRQYGTSTTQGDTDVIGVLDDVPTGASQNVRVRHIGYQPVVRVTGAVTAGHFLRQSASAGLAEDAGTSIVSGAFAIAITSAAGPGEGSISAYLFPPEYGVGGSGYDTVEDEGSGLTQRSTINFTGAGVSAADSGGKTVVTISGATASALGPNEIENFPSLEGADDTQPEWWEEADANATLTEVDTAGEAGLSEYHERALKVVVASANSYAYQRYTYADQPRLKSGKVVSVAVAVWSVSAVSARIRLQSSVGSLGVSSTTTTAGWTVLTVENVTLNGTYVELRLEVDVGTAYFIPLGLAIGTSAPAVFMPPRGLVKRFIDPVNIKDYAGLGDEATWTDIDVTANTSNLAAIALLGHFLAENTAGDRFDLGLRRNGSSVAFGGDPVFSSARMGVSSIDAGVSLNHHPFILDDQQIFEYYLDRVAGSGTLLFGQTVLYGWEEWG